MEGYSNLCYSGFTHIRKSSGKGWWSNFSNFVQKVLKMNKEHNKDSNTTDDAKESVLGTALWNSRDDTDTVVDMPTSKDLETMAPFVIFIKLLTVNVHLCYCLVHFILFCLYKLL